MVVTFESYGSEAQALEGGQAMLSELRLHLGPDVTAKVTARPATTGDQPMSDNPKAAADLADAMSFYNVDAYEAAEMLKRPEIQEAREHWTGDHQRSLNGRVSG